VGKPRSAIGAFILAAMLLPNVGCAANPNKVPTTTTAASGWLIDRLYFGTAISGGGEVSEADWKAFLGDTVTPRFPDGLTTWRASGQWRTDKGIVSEGSFILELAHASNEASARAIQEIRAEYKRRFKQESVMQVTAPGAVQF
jgi:Protein of unknown function (DUF3574)